MILINLVGSNKTQPRKSSWRKRRMLADPDYREKVLAEKRAYAKKFREKYPERVKESSRRSYLKNRLACIKRAAKYKELYRSDSKMSEKLKEQARQYELKNKDKIRKRKSEYYRSEHYKLKRKLYRAEKFKSDLHFYMRYRLACRVKNAIKNQGTAAKRLKTEELVGCSVEYLVKYIESKFLPGMSWTNRELWHLDHIIPCASFDLSLESEQKECFKYTNLCPMWSEDNLKKSDRMPDGTKGRAARNKRGKNL